MPYHSCHWTRFHALTLLLMLITATLLSSISTPEDSFTDFTVDGDTTLLGDFFVLDGQNKMIYGIDLDKALGTPNSSDAIMSRLDLLDDNGDQISANPLGLAVGNRKVYVSFDDRSLYVYPFPKMYKAPNDPDPVFAPVKYQLPRVATRMDISDRRNLDTDVINSYNVLHIDDDYLAYISDEPEVIDVNETLTWRIHFLDPGTLEDKGSVPVNDPPKPDFVNWEDGEELRNGYQLTGVSAFPLPEGSNEPGADWGDFSFFNGWNKMGYGVLSLGPDSLTIVDPTGNPQMNFTAPETTEAETVMETSLDLIGPQSHLPQDYALATRIIVGMGDPNTMNNGPVGSLNHVIRNGREIEVKQGERIFKSTWFPRTDLTMYDYSTYPQRTNFFWWGTSLDYDVPMESMKVHDGRVSFEVISFRDDFLENTTVFYPEITYYDIAPGDPSPFGDNPKLPYSIHTLGDVDPFALTPAQAVSLTPAVRTTASYDPRLWLDDGQRPEPGPIGVLMGFEPSGSYKLVPEDDPVAGEFEGTVVNLKEVVNTELAKGGLPSRYYFELLNWIGQVYLGTDATTGARYSGNYCLDPIPATSSFTLPSEISKPQDIAVISYAPPTISGKVTTQDRNNRNVPLQNVELRITTNNGAATYTTFTDSDGEYSFAPRGLSTRDFKVEVILRDRDGYLTLRSKAGYNDNIVSLRTKRFAFTEATDIQGFSRYKDAELNIQFSSTYAHLDPTTSAAQKAVLRDSAIYYHNTHTALDYALNTLGLIPDHKLPVDLHIHSNTAGVYYSTATSSINVEAAGGNSGAAVWESPDNREYHEFGHHVQTDSSMGGSNNLPAYLPGDVNHGGVMNSDSKDSVVEGFAEFFSILVKGDSRYQWSNAALTDLEGNFHETTVAPGKIGPDEEFNVATLLWDLVDDDTEAGDLMKLGISDVWSILDSKDITTVHSIYTAFNNSYGWKDTNATDGHSDLDLLFITHRFYSDTNKNGQWDAGEKIGYADYYEPKTAEGKAARNDRPHVNGTTLSFTLLDPDGNPLPDGQFTISVTFNDTMYDYSYITGPLPGNGTIDLYVPQDCLGMEIDPLTPGFTGSPLVIDPQDFWDHVSTAQADESDIYLNETFQLAANAIPSPASLTAFTDDPALIFLSWDTAPGYDTVVVVRGTAGQPISPWDGEVVFEGSGTSYADMDALPGLEYHYSLFTKDGDEYSQGISISVEVPIDLTESTDDQDPDDDDDDDDPDPDDDDDPDPDPDTTNGTGEEDDDDDDDDDGFPVLAAGGIAILLVLILVGALLYMNVITLPGMVKEGKAGQKDKEGSPPPPSPPPPPPDNTTGIAGSGDDPTTEDPPR